MFMSMNKWGFPWKVEAIVKAYKKGEITLEEALNRMGALYSVNIGTCFSYDEKGKKVWRTYADFGCPVEVRYIF